LAAAAAHHTWLPGSAVARPGQGDRGQLPVRQGFRCRCPGALQGWQGMAGVAGERLQQRVHGVAAVRKEQEMKHWCCSEFAFGFPHVTRLLFYSPVPAPADGYSRTAQHNVTCSAAAWCSCCARPSSSSASTCGRCASFGRPCCGPGPVTNRHHAHCVPGGPHQHHFCPGLQPSAPAAFFGIKGLHCTDMGPGWLAPGTVSQRFRHRLDGCHPLRERG
jgi:hypothetical protein